MRTMSWSRYRCLSWSLQRIRLRLRRKRAGEAAMKGGGVGKTRNVNPPGVTGAGSKRRGATNVFNCPPIRRARP